MRSQACTAASASRAVGCTPPIARRASSSSTAFAGAQSERVLAQACDHGQDVGQQRVRLLDWWKSRLGVGNSATKPGIPAARAAVPR